MKKSLTLLFALVSGFWMPAGAQEVATGDLFGSVRDARTRSPLPGAVIRILGTNFATATDTGGQFRITRIPSGQYGVSASIIGYDTRVQSDVMIYPGKPQKIEFDLPETTIELEDVTVTGSYFKKLPEAPVSLRSQSNEEIRRLPGGLEDVVRAVSILPGVAQAQAGRNDLIVRGGAPSENLYTVDGIPVPNINHFATQGASGGPLSYLNLDYVAGTDFSSGGFGAQYGDRLSSVLAITMREGRSDRIGGKATVSATQFGLNVEGPIEEKGSFLFSARRSYLDFIFKASGFGFVPEYWDFLGKATYRLSGQDQLSVLGIVALDDVKTFNDTPDQRYDNSQVLVSNQNQAAGGISWQHLMPQGLLTFTLGQSYIDYAYEQNDSLLQSIFSNISSENEISFTADALWKVASQTEVSAGLQGKSIRFKADLLLPPFRTSFGESLAVDAVYDTTGYKAAGYGQLTQRFGSLSATLGARIDYFSLIEQDPVLSLRLGLSYALTSVTSINASVGQYRQTPSYIWLVSYPQNRLLSQTKANQFILGIDHLFAEDLRVTLEGYYKEYREYPASELRPYLVLANTGAGFGGADEGFASFGVDPLVSSGRGDARGMELFVQKKFSDTPFYGSFSLSYSQTNFTPLNGVERPGTFDQHWILNLGGGYVFDEHWEAGIKFRFATGRPYTPYNADGTQDAALYNTVRVPVNHSLDVRVDRRWFFSSWTLITYLDIQNIYNRKPNDVPRYDARTGTLDATASIGILPSIGVSAEF
jgi:hypothetical protein